MIILFFSGITLNNCNSIIKHHICDIYVRLCVARMQLLLDRLNCNRRICHWPSGVCFSKIAISHYCFSSILFHKRRVLTLKSGPKSNLLELTFVLLVSRNRPSSWCSIRLSSTIFKCSTFCSSSCLQKIKW